MKGYKIQNRSQKNSHSCVPLSRRQSRLQRIYHGQTYARVDFILQSGFWGFGLWILRVGEYLAGYSRHILARSLGTEVDTPGQTWTDPDRHIDRHSAQYERMRNLSSIPLSLSQIVRYLEASHSFLLSFFIWVHPSLRSACVSRLYV
jgi:hypothetical protein